MKREFSDVEKEIVEIEVEKSRLNREKAMIVLNKSLFIYFCFLFVGIIGFINSYLSKTLLNAIILVGLIVLVLGTIPYVQTMKREEKKLNTMVDDLRNKGVKI